MHLGIDVVVAVEYRQRRSRKGDGLSLRSFDGRRFGCRPAPRLQAQSFPRQRVLPVAAGSSVAASRLRRALRWRIRVCSGFLGRCLRCGGRFGGGFGCQRVPRSAASVAAGASVADSVAAGSSVGCLRCGWALRWRLRSQRAPQWQLRLQQVPRLRLPSAGRCASVGASVAAGVLSPPQAVSDRTIAQHQRSRAGIRGQVGSFSWQSSFRIKFCHILQAGTTVD